MNHPATSHVAPLSPAQALQLEIDGLLERFAWQDPEHEPLPIPRHRNTPLDLTRRGPSPWDAAVGER
ncbi:MAG: hypothetical protein Q8K38_02635 [Burkholderiaceae bacterium]|nr:hypothetical protein [Burkholderiaceae bacterium]MDZ4146403.1 hypothetical protein [Burkholderiales bacterium]